MPTSTLRPDSSSGFGTVTGAASAHAALNDNSDASYVTSNAAAFDFVLSLGTFSLPAGAVVRSITPRIRHRASGPFYPSLTVSIAGVAIGSSYFVSTPSSFATETGAAIAGGQSQGDVDNLQIQIAIGFFAPGYWDWQVAELYLDVFYATIPSVAVSAPTGAITTTTRPVVAWTHTAGTDGGSQSAYQVKVFNAAQYGAGGFNPTTSTAEYDSGIVESSANQATSGPLSTPTTLRAYVRTAQTINGQYQWSDWAFSGFTTNVTLPAISTITVVPDSTLGRHRITVTRNTGTLNWTMIEVERSDDGGVTWVAVRGATDAAPPGDVWIGYDYEAPNGTAVLYRARGKTATVDGVWLTSSSATWTSSSTWLKDLVDTANSQTVRARVLPDIGRGRDVAVLYPVGAAAPVVIADVTRLASGTLEISTLTAAQATDLRALLENFVLLLQPPPSHGLAAMYVAIVGDVVEMRPLRPAQSAHRVWSVPFVEVDRPVDEGVVVSGLTWQDVVNTYATWTAVVAGVATWGALT